MDCKEYLEKVSAMYVCDPSKNEKCRKTNCFIMGGECHCTLDKHFARTNKSGEPVRYADTLVDGVDIIAELNKARRDGRIK